jgi:hypothetical protein
LIGDMFSSSSSSNFVSFEKIVMTTQNVPDLTIRFLVGVFSTGDLPFLLLMAISARSSMAILHFFHRHYWH